MFNKYMQKVFDNQIKRRLFYIFGSEVAAEVWRNIADKKHQKVWNYTFFVYLCSRKTIRGVAQPG